MPSGSWFVVHTRVAGRCVVCYNSYQRAPAWPMPKRWGGIGRTALCLFGAQLCGSNAVVAYLPSKQTVAGSNPVSRSTLDDGPDPR